MKRNLPLFFLLFSVFFTVLLFVLNNRQSNLSRPVISEDEFFFREKNDELNQRLSGRQLANITCMDSARNMFSLSDLTDKSTLIFHFSEHHCGVCYEDEIRMLQAFFADNFHSILILCSYESYRSFMFFLRMNQIRFPVYRIEHRVIEWELNEYGYPYYFVLHPDMKISHIYIPNKAYPESNKQYLEGVKRFLLE